MILQKKLSGKALRVQSLGRTALALSAATALLAVAVTQSQAAVTAYSDVTSFGGSYYANGSTTAVDSPSVDYTPLVADDITPLSSTVGAPVTSISFSVVNVSGAAISFNPELRFYAADGSGSAPGTLLDAINVSPITQSSGTIQVYTLTSGSPTGFFSMPSLFWAGEAFADGGTDTATSTTLAGLGQGFFNPPTTGSSGNVFFQSSTTTDFTTNNPSGGLYSFGTTPVANFGWAFSVTPVPEPASITALALVGAGLLARRRRIA